SRRRRFRPTRLRLPIRRDRGRESYASRERRSSRRRASVGGGRRRARPVRPSSVAGVGRLVASRLGHEQIRAATLVPADEFNCCVALGESVLERITRGKPPLERELYVAGLQLLERAGDLEEEMGRALCFRNPARFVTLSTKKVSDPLSLGVAERRWMVLAAEALVRAVVADRPLDIDPIGREALIQLVGHGAVEIAVIRARVRAELPEVEACVTRFEGVHGPSDDLDPLIEAVVSLRFLELLR